MPFCHYCGAENPESARFCDQCGTELIPVNESEQQVAPAPPDVDVPVSAGPETCPQCGLPVIPGEAFCDNCGASLLAPSTSTSGTPPQQTYPPPQPVNMPATPPPGQPAPPPQASSAATDDPFSPASEQPVASQGTPAPSRTTLSPSCLVIRDTGHSLPLPDSDRVVVGRSDPVSNFYPDLDLSEHGALQNGVGRRHMRLSVQENQISVEDLDSTNGTFLNGQRLAPRVPRALNDGDELCLGKLVLRVQL